MRTLLLAALLLVCAAPCAWAQSASGYMGVSATVLPAPATVGTTGAAELSVRRGVAGLSTALRLGGTGPATLDVTTDASARCDIVPDAPGARGTTAVATSDAGRRAGRLTCALTGGRRDAAVPVTLWIIPAT
jgi:hypothetical protein